MTAATWKRPVAGHYRLDGTDWLVQRTEGEQSAPGYRWVAMHPDRGEFYANTLRCAKAKAEG